MSAASVARSQGLPADWNRAWDKKDWLALLSFIPFLMARGNEDAVIRCFSSAQAYAYDEAVYHPSRGDSGGNWNNGLLGLRAALLVFDDVLVGFGSETTQGQIRHWRDQARTNLLQLLDQNPPHVIDGRYRVVVTGAPRGRFVVSLTQYGQRVIGQQTESPPGLGTIVWKGDFDGRLLAGRWTSDASNISAEFYILVDLAGSNHLKGVLLANRPGTTPQLARVDLIRLFAD